MEKLDYLFRTSRGNHSRYMERYSRRIQFATEQETYSKKSMLEREKLRFQQEFGDWMRANNRKSFRGEVVLQLDFYPSRSNPPSIHQLAKNYLDLLWRPAQGLRNPRLPLQDDRQISILIVNYHIQQKNTSPSIEVQMAPLGDFYDDLRLFGLIRTGNFPEDDETPRYDLEKVIPPDDSLALFDKSVEKLRDHEELKELITPENYENLKNIHLVDYQSAFFGLEKIKPSDLILFLQKSNLEDDLLGSMLSDHRNFVITHSLTPLRAAGLPTRMGDTEKFKNTVRGMINEFKERYPILFPLRINLSLTILYVPPSGQEIDLDNLARYIVPFINEALKPPVGFWFYDYQRPKGYPAHTIIQYQIIKIPRNQHDPEDGVVKLVFGEYEPYNNCWHDVDRTINLWSDEAF